MTYIVYRTVPVYVRRRNQMTLDLFLQLISVNHQETRDIGLSISCVKYISYFIGIIRCNNYMIDRRRRYLSLLQLCVQIDS